MSRFALAEQAQSDLSGVADHAKARWDVAQAVSYVDALAARLQQLAASPMMGRERPDLMESVRSFPVESHIVYYHPVPDGILVLRILHQRQDPHRHIG